MEEILRFGCQDSLVGIVSNPSTVEERSSATGVIFLNAGFLHRIGPNRLFVTLARRLAALGFVCLRFDHSGIGDSPARRDNLPLEKARALETREAMDVLSHEKGCTRFLIVSLCSGTLTAFRAACSDPRISDLILLNALLEDPDSISDELAARVINRKVARSYWTDKLFRLRSWKKLLKGGTRLGRVVRVTGTAFSSMVRGSANPPPEAARVIENLRELSDRGVGILFVFGERTIFLEYFRLTLQSDVAELTRTGGVSMEVMKDADHGFTSVYHQELVSTLVEDWVTDRIALPDPAPAS